MILLKNLTNQILSSIAPQHRKLTRNQVNAKLPLNILGNCSKGPKIALLGRKDVRNFCPCVLYRTSVLWGRCPALTLLHQLIAPSRVLGTADHVQSLDDQVCMFMWMGIGVWMGVGCPCPPVRNDIVTPRHLFPIRAVFDELCNLASSRAIRKNTKEKSARISLTTL